MDAQRAGPTRLWWDGREVCFVRWTERSLVFAWHEADETAMHIPRGAVVRLIDRGVIGIEGALPDWLHEQSAANVTRPLTLPPREPAPARPISPPPVRPAALPRPVPAVQVAPPVHVAPRPEPPAPPAPTETFKSRFNIIARLIRKLGGDPSRGGALNAGAPARDS